MPVKKIIDVLLDYLFATLHMSFSDAETDKILKTIKEGRYLKTYNPLLKTKENNR